MGFFSSIGSIFSSTPTTKEEQETPATLRQKHGFSDFSAEMKRMQAFDPEQEMKNALKSPLSKTASTSSPSRKKK